MNHFRLLPLAAVVLCLGTLVGGRASAIEVSAVCTGNVGLNGDQVGNHVVYENYGPSPAQCFASRIDAIGGESGHGQSQGYAGIGLQRAASFANADVSLNSRPETSGSSNVLGDTQVRVVDSFRMASSQVAPGSWVSVTMAYHVFGVVDSSGLGTGSGWDANAGWGDNNYAVTLVQGNSVLAGSSGEQRFLFGAVNSTEDTSDGNRFNGLHQLSFNVLAGSSIDLYISLRALSFSLAYASTEAPLGVVHSSADMGHSITWAGISAVRDADGNLLDDYSAFNADRSFDYARAYGSVSSVPETSTLAMLLAGFGVLGLWRRSPRATSSAR